MKRGKRAVEGDGQGRAVDRHLVSFTLEIETIARVDALAGALAFPGATATRSLALRAALLVGLAAFEAERAKPGATRKRRG